LKVTWVKVYLEPKVIVESWAEVVLLRKCMTCMSVSTMSILMKSRIAYRTVARGATSSRTDSEFVTAVADPRTGESWALLQHEIVSGEYPSRNEERRVERGRKMIQEGVSGARMEHSRALLVA
jgi:hypothetical protein